MAAIMLLAQKKMAPIGSPCDWPDNWPRNWPGNWPGKRPCNGTAPPWAHACSRASDKG